MILARVLDVSDAPVTSLDALLDAATPLARSTLAPGGEAVPTRAPLWTCGTHAIDAPHVHPGVVTSDVQLYAVRDAVVGGPGAHAMAQGAYLWAAGAYPGYVRYWIETDITADTWAVPALPRRRISTAFVITHFNHVWGHWLTEMYPKLFVVRHLAALGVTAPILLPSTAPGYMRAIIEATLPGQEVIAYNPRRETVEVGRLLLPDMLNRHYAYHALMTEAVETEVRRSLGRRTPAGDRIFVSRRAMLTPSAYRQLDNAEALEAEAVSRGFEVVHPEALPWPEQIAAFAQASVVVGEFGSGLHNTIMSPPGTRVVAFNWIVDVQSWIARFRRQDVGYILPDDGRMRGFTLEDQGLQTYRIDLDVFRRRLDQVLDPLAPPSLRRYDAVPV